MFQDIGILFLLTEHVDVLALLYFIRYIEQCGLLRFFFGFIFFFCRFLCLCLVNNFCLGSLFLRLRFPVFFDAVFEGQIFAINILEQHIIHHLVGEFAVFDASEFDEGTDIVPVFLIAFAICLAHAAELVCHFLADVIGNLLYETIVLQRASGYIQRQIRAIDHTF